MTGPIDEAVSAARDIIGDGATPTEFFSAVHEVAKQHHEDASGAGDGSPIPDGFMLSREFHGEDYSVPEFESPDRSNSGMVIPPLVSVVAGHLRAKGKPGEWALAELELILAIRPPEPVLADYRALRLRNFFEEFVRAALNAVVSPDGASNAARIISSDRGFRRDAFSELGRFMLAALTSGTNRSIAGAVRVYVEAVR